MMQPLPLAKESGSTSLQHSTLTHLANSQSQTIVQPKTINDLQNITHTSLTIYNCRKYQLSFTTSLLQASPKSFTSRTHYSAKMQKEVKFLNGRGCWGKRFNNHTISRWSRRRLASIWGHINVNLQHLTFVIRLWIACNRGSQWIFSLSPNLLWCRKNSNCSCVLFPRWLALCEA